MTQCQTACMCGRTFSLQLRHHHLLFEHDRLRTDTQQQDLGTDTSTLGWSRRSDAPVRVIIGAPPALDASRQLATSAAVHYDLLPFLLQRLLGILSKILVAFCIQQL